MGRFLVDQQLPYALARHLTRLGHDALHIKDYPGGSTLPDIDIARIADAEHRFVVTKDVDFRVSHLLGKGPARPGSCTSLAETSRPTICSRSSTVTTQPCRPR